MREKLAKDVDADLERRIHTLSYPMICQRVPRLIKNTVGFELHKADDDQITNTGAWVFRVGKQQVLIPVVYENGKISGLNLMYLPDEDMFIPALETMVDKLFSRQVFALGRQPKNDREMRGLGVGRSALYETLTNAMGKSASALDLGRVITKFASPEKAMLSVINTMRANDEFGRVMLKFYPPERLEEIAKAAQEKTQRKFNPGVKFTSKNKVSVCKNKDALASYIGLTDSERDELLRTGVVIRDGRSDKDTSKTYNIGVPMEWREPDATGNYDLVNASGNIVKAFVCDNPITIGEGSVNGSVAIFDGCGGIYGHNSLLAVNSDEEAREPDVKGIKDISSHGLKADDWFVLMDEKGRCTVPARYLTQTKGDDGAQTLYVSQLENIQKQPEHSRDTSYPCEVDSLCDSTRLKYDAKATPVPHDHLDGKPTSEYDFKTGHRIVVLPESDHGNMRNVADILYAGKKCRVIPLPDGTAKASSLVAQIGTTTGLLPLQKKAGCSKMRVRANMDEYRVTCGVIDSGRCNRRDALVHLVYNHGLSKSAAHELLCDADVKALKQQEAVCAIKYAASYPVAGDHGEPSETVESETIDMSSMEGTGPFLARDIQLAMNASRTGEKSVVDSAALLALLNTHNVSGMIDELVPDLMLQIDTIGRLLYMIYNHREELEERYGKEDLKVIEDSLENVFRELGELVVRMQEDDADQLIGDTGSTGLGEK